jgi:hypothetical protein
MSIQNKPITLSVNQRELATILAALRFHQDENLQGTEIIADQVVREIATDCGLLTPLNSQEVDELCQRLNFGESTAGLHIDPPHPESGDEPLFRVVYVIDLNAANARDAADYAHRIMSDPQSQPPVFQIIDHTGTAVTVDLSAT